MDVTANETRRDATSKKKYDLCLKRSKQKIQSIPAYSGAKENKENPPLIPKSRETTSDFGDSQNFMLRLSDSFDAHDVTSEKPRVGMVESKTSEVIVISDSSDEGSPERYDWMRFVSSASSRGAKEDPRPRSILIKSSDSEDDDELIGQGSKAGSVAEKLPAKEPPRRCSILYTSDDPASETESGVSFGNKENIDENRDTSEPRKMTQNVDKSLPIVDRLRGILSENRCNINTPQSAKNTKNIVERSVESKRTPASEKITSRTTILTKRDTRNILKAIKSTKLVYESPKDWKKLRVTDSSESDESDDSSGVRKTNENIGRQKAVVIAETETESDSDDEVVRGSRVNIAKPYKTHVSRFLEPAIADETDMSEKKKLEVAQWLMTNSRDSRSDTSLSNVSASQKNSPNSGNSSLERLEMNYETPNNRGKLRTPNTGAKSNAAASSTKSTKPVRQTTIDNFVKTSKDGTRKFFTPVATTVARRNDLISPAVKEATEAMAIEDCADILDNLYGESWRKKANDLLPPATEPRKTNVGRKDKGVQTERKVNPRTKIFGGASDSSSHEDDFAKFVQNIRPNLNSTKKPTAKASRRRCSFINDSSSSSENCGESTYMTALTTPRISDTAKSRNRMTPQSSALQRIKAICDSDSDDKAAKNKQPTDYRKHLSFSDDASDSSTSEYDPSDIIPPKVTMKPPSYFKTLKTPPKVTSASVYARQPKKVEKSKTFLESLSATIPLTSAHLDARKYRQNFKNTKEELCKYLYKLYNEKIFDNKLPSDMSIEWNVRMRGTAGFCYNKKSVKALGGVTRSSRLVLATKILDTPDRLRDTLVHEMCHAAAWLINEVSDGHGPFWKAWASKAMKAFPELPPIRRCHEYDIKTKFTYRCVGCGYSIGRHSKSLDVERKRCGHCYGKFELLINKVTKSGTVEVKTPTTKKPTAFALFVKENYQTVKKERRGAAHKEVMQILGQQFSAIKITKKNGNSDENNSDSVSNGR